MWCHAGIMGFWGWTMMIVLWGGLGALIVWSATSAKRGRPQLDPIETLGRRFAAGEISRDEYEERRGVLGSRS